MHLEVIKMLDVFEVFKYLLIVLMIIKMIHDIDVFLAQWMRMSVHVAAAL